MSQQAARQSPWRWDKARHLYYKVEQSTGDLVYENGQRIRSLQEAAQQLHRPQAGSAFGISGMHQPVAIPSRSAASSARSQLPVRSTAQLSDSVDREASSDTEMRVRHREWEQNGMRVFDAHNLDTLLRTRYATSPPERITDPSLYGAGITAHQVLFGDGEGDAERLYPSYRLKPSGFFKVGTIFGVLSASPYINSESAKALTIDAEIAIDQRRREVIAKIRRFVVIKEGANHCSAIPILTYGDQGVGERGVVKSEHSVIYTGESVPKLPLSEMPMRQEAPMRPPIRATLDERGAKLDRMSRIRYSQIYTVQHNVKVRRFGSVHRDSMETLSANFQNVWAARGQPLLTLPAAPSNSITSADPNEDSDEEREEREDEVSDDGERDDEESDDEEREDEVSDDGERNDEESDDEESDDEESDDKINDYTEGEVQQTKYAVQSLMRQGYSTEQAKAFMRGRLQSSGWSRKTAENLLLACVSALAGAYLAGGREPPATRSVRPSPGSSTTSSAAPVLDYYPVRSRQISSSPATAGPPPLLSSPSVGSRLFPPAPAISTSACGPSMTTRPVRPSPGFSATSLAAPASDYYTTRSRQSSSFPTTADSQLISSSSSARPRQFSSVSDVSTSSSDIRDPQPRSSPADHRNEFLEKRRQLQQILDHPDNVCMCKRLDGAKPKLRDRFTPLGIAEQILAGHKTLVLDLYMASFNYSKTMSVGHSECNSQRFFEGLKKRANVFATLLFSDFEIMSKAWQRFITICVSDDNASRTQLLDHDMPFDYSFWVSCLGPSDVEHSLFDRINATQHRFCPVKLEHFEQVSCKISKELLRIPLLEKQKINKGAFGRVFRVKVKAGHFDQFNHDTIWAMKKMKMNQQNTFEWGDAQWLFRQQPLKHESIMRAIASVKTSDRIYIFFPLATYDLRTHMNGDSPQELQKQLVQFKCLIGVAEALKYLHTELYTPEPDKKHVLCIHKDLKAENILVVTEADGTLCFQITDFGISSIISPGKEFDRSSAYTREPRSLRDISTRTVLEEHCPNFAPEALNHGRVTASVDMWSLGVVISEFIAWLSGGLQSLMDFEDARGGSNGPQRKDSHYLSFEQDFTTKTIQVKAGIWAWFENLLSQEGEGHVQFYRRCIKVLQEDLLVIEPKQRARVEKVCETLHAIHNQFETGSEDWVVLKAGSL